MAVTEQSSYVIRRLIRVVTALPNTEWTLAAIVLAVISVTFMFLSGLISKERFATRSAREFTSWQALRTTLLNANYKRVIAVHVTVWAAAAFGNFLVPYLTIYRVKKPSLIMPLCAVVAIAGVIALPIWIRLSRTLEKSVVLRIICVWEALKTPIFWLAFSPSHPYLVFLTAIWGGAGQGGTLAYVRSMIGVLPMRTSCSQVSGEKACIWCIRTAVEICNLLGAFMVRVRSGSDWVCTKCRADSGDYFQDEINAGYSIAEQSCGVSVSTQLFTESCSA